MWTLLSLLALLLLALGGGAIWLWGWQWRSELDFHESWTAEERAALTAFDHYLRRELLSEFTKVFDACSLPLPDRVLHTAMLRQHIAPTVSKLRDMAESGQAGVREGYDTPYHRNVTPAIVAAQCAQFKALEALVAHGADPNATMYQKWAHGSERPVDTPICPLLGNSYLVAAPIPWDERRPTADFLLQHGAKLHTDYISLCCTIPLVQEGHDTQPLQWALEHGVKPGPRALSAIIGLPQTLDVLKRLLKDNIITANDESATETILQSLLEQMASISTPEDMQHYQYEEKLDLLLAYGADPNRIHSRAGQPQTDECDDTPWQDLPLDIYLRHIELVQSPAMQETQQRIISKLRAAGARSTYQPQHRQRIRRKPCTDCD